MTRPFALLFLGACAGDATDKPGETGTVEPCTTFYDGPISLTSLDVSCDDDDTVRFFAETAGSPATALVFAVNTGSDVRWSEEHDLESYEADECGFWDRLERVVPGAPAPATDAAAYVRNEASSFGCAEHYEPALVTYAFVALDADGAPLHCVVAGHDPQGLIDGTYDDDFTAEPTLPIDAPACAIGALGR
jgi:hypothetical protein